MTRLEYWYRRLVIAVARPVPVESPGWATAGIFAPNFVSWVLVRGTLQSAEANKIVATFFTHKHLFWMEVGIHALMGMVGFAFLCRLLQITDLKYFDRYKLEEMQ